MSKHLNIHPGELLREEFLGPMAITPYRLAKDAKLPHQRVNEIVNKKRGITAETDLHLCAYFGLTPGYYNPALTLEDVRDHFDQIRNEDGYIVPKGPSDEFAQLLAAFGG